MFWTKDLEWEAQGYTHLARLKMVQKSDANASTGLLEEAAIDTLCGIVRNKKRARYSSFIPVVADVL